MVTWAEISRLDFWRQLLDSDFNCGFIGALALVLAVIILMLLLKLVFFLLFRVHRCSEVVVPVADGDLVISKDAVSSVVARELRSFTELEIFRIRLFRKGKRYRLQINCALRPEAVRGLPELAGAIKPQVLESLKRLFGIENVEQIRFKIEEYDADDDNSTPLSAAKSIPHAAMDFGIH